MSGNGPQSKRITQVVERWFLTEPLLFAAWTTHRILPNPKIENVRVRSGSVEFSPSFFESLDDRTLTDVMRFETLRIILKHPYERRRPNGELAWEASNLAIQECLHTALPMPSAEDRFETDTHNKKFYEYYYNLLWGAQADGDCDDDVCGECGDSECEGDCDGEESAADDNDSNAECDGACESCGESTCDGSCDGNSAGSGESGNQKQSQQPCSVGDYCDSQFSGLQNSIDWDYDQLFIEQLNDIITDIESSDSWGTVPGSGRELILASRTPRLDYRRVLRQFRSTILSTDRRLTRMKPSRRYGFQYMGSRRDFTTRLLFAVDVSGSVSSSDIRTAFAIVNRLFKYGIESIDVLWFDTQIRNDKPIEIKRARREIEVSGRGGTCFQPIMDYLDDHRQYDGLIIFTDGIAPVPDRPKRNRRTRVVWLFNNEQNWRSQQAGLTQPGMSSAFVLPG